MKYIKKINESELIKKNTLLPIVENQIISTKLTENDSVLMQLFSFSKGQSISDHNSLQNNLFFVVKGSIQVGSDTLNENEAIYKSIDKSIGQTAIEDTLLLSLSFKEGIELKNIEADSVINLEQYIALVKNSVSSNTLLQNKDISMTLMALDGDESLSTHAASGDAMVVNLLGDVDININKEEFKVTDEDIIIMPAGIPHGLKAIKPFKMLLIVVKN